MSEAAPPISPLPGFVPLTIGQILDRIFRLLWTHVFLFLKIASIPAAGFFALYGLIAVALLASGAFTRPLHQPDPMKIMAVLLPVGLAGGVALMLVYAVFEAAGSYAALEANRGNKVSFRAAYAVAWRNAGRFLWLMILRTLWVGLPILGFYGGLAGVALLQFAGHGNPNPGVYFVIFPLIFLAYCGAFVYAIFMSIRLALAPPICVAEQLTAASALRRSLNLTRNAKGRIFLVLLVVYAAGYAAFVVFEAVCFALVAGGFIFAAAIHMDFHGPWSVIAISILALFAIGFMFLWIAALTASYSIAFAVLYHDQRLRIEGIPPMAPAGEQA